MSIRLSEKHGVNPMLMTCFWCGENRGDIALLGKLKGDAEAPRHVVLDYEPCDQCKEKMDKGIMIAEAVEHPANENQIPFYKGCYPTGNWSVVKEEAVREFLRPEVWDSVLKHRACFLDPEGYWKLFGGDA